MADWKAMLERIQGQPMVCLEPAESDQQIIIPCYYERGRIHVQLGDKSGWRPVSDVKFVSWSDALNEWVIIWT